MKKRLTSPRLLGIYSSFLKKEGVIHLKTDCLHLHEYTKAVVKENNLDMVSCCDDIYGKGYADEILSIKTTYEAKFLAEGSSITYLSFRPEGKNIYSAPDFEPDNTLSL